MADLVRRHSLSITALVLLICAFQLTSISISHPGLPQFGGKVVNAVLSPLEKLHHELTYSLQSFWTHYIWLIGVTTERDELISRLKALEAENSDFIELRNENDRLRALLDFSKQTELEGLAVTVIGRDPSNWNQTLTIDRGSSDGLRAGLPVFDGHAIVGQIIAASSSSAVVLLLVDSRSAIDVIIQNTRAPGIVEGSLDGLLSLRYLIKEFPVSLGDRIIASGLDGVYPKGTLVGVVTQVDSTARGLFQKIEITPSANLSRLENLFVYIPERTRTE